MKNNQIVNADMKRKLTKEEKSAIRSLKRLADRWPESLWVFSTNDRHLWIMKLDEKGKRANADSGARDRNFIVDAIDIPNEGGDW